MLCNIYKMSASMNKKHHEKLEFCTTRAPYRQGRQLKSVKVYTVAKESKYLLVQGVPELGLDRQLQKLCGSWGEVEGWRVLTDYPGERFTQTYLCQYRTIQSARYGKRKLDDYSFYGGVLHVCYAPEYESVGDTREKLQQRRKEVARRIRILEAENQSADKRSSVPGSATDVSTEASTSGTPVEHSTQNQQSTPQTQKLTADTERQSDIALKQRNVTQGQSADTLESQQNESQFESKVNLPPAELPPYTRHFQSQTNQGANYRNPQALIQIQTQPHVNYNYQRHGHNNNPNNYQTRTDHERADNAYNSGVETFDGHYLPRPSGPRFSVPTPRGGFQHPPPPPPNLRSGGLHLHAPPGWRPMINPNTHRESAPGGYGPTHPLVFDPLAQGMYPSMVGDRLGAPLDKRMGEWAHGCNEMEQLQRENNLGDNRRNVEDNSSMESECNIPGQRSNKYNVQPPNNQFMYNKSFSNGKYLKNNNLNEENRGLMTSDNNADLPLVDTSTVEGKDGTKNEGDLVIKDYNNPSVNASKFIPRQTNKKILPPHLLSSVTKVVECMSSSEASEINQKRNSKRKADPINDKLRLEACILGDVKGPMLPLKQEVERLTFKASETGDSSVDRSMKEIRDKVMQFSAIAQPPQLKRKKKKT